MQHFPHRLTWIAAGLLLTGAAWAQNAPPTTGAGHSPAASSSSAAASGGKVTAKTHFVAANGARVTIKSRAQSLPDEQQAPSFSSLAGHSGRFITRSEASAYPLLANDFEHADANRDGHISKSEYEHWLKH